MKEHLGSTGERFHVGRVFGEKADDPLGDAVFTADVSKRADHDLEVFLSGTPPVRRGSMSGMTERVNSLSKPTAP